MKKIFCVVLQLLLFVSVSAQDAAEYERKAFVSSQGDMLNYRFLRPETEIAGEKYPVVLFLHGAGERGSDNEKQLVHGGQMWLNPVVREQYPAYVIFPQCPDDGYWAYLSRPESFLTTEIPVQEAPSPVIVTVKELLDSIMSLSQVDKDRIYVMGLSMGGMATFDMAIRYPDVFAAAVPICGTVNSSRLPAAKDVKFRIYHGDADNVVPVAGSREAYKALKAAGADVLYFEFPGVNHGSWHNAFNDPTFLTWLFSQKKQTSYSNNQSSALHDSDDEPMILWDPVQQPYYLNGGSEGLLNDLYNAMVKTVPVTQDRVKGRALVSFIISKDGQIDTTSIRVIRNKSVPDDYLNAAIEAIKNLGKFEPGKMNGIPKNVTWNQPIIYPIPVDYLKPTE